MGKAVMLSIRPEWCEKIASGKKTVEVRKNRPKLETPFKCYIYCTKAKQMQSNNGFFGYADELNFDRNGKIKFGFIPPELWPAVGMNGKVIGEFVCDKIDEVAMDEKYDFLAMLGLSDRSCVSLSQLDDYANGQYYLYGWHISNLKIYDQPKKIYDFHRFGAATPEELDDGLCCYCRRTNYGELAAIGTPNGATFCEGRFCDDAYREYLDENFMLNRPPQSWCYIEEVQNEAVG